jgi:transposase-like protein
MQPRAATHTEFVTCDNTIDETYTRLNGHWTYIYRAIDEHGQVVDAYFSQRRNGAAAEAFFRRAIAETGSTPTRVTTGYPLGEGLGKP